MNIAEIKKKAGAVKNAIRFVFTQRRLPTAEISNPSDSANLTMIEMLDVIRAAEEVADSSSNIRRGDFVEVYEDFLSVVSIASHIPQLSPLREALEVEHCLARILPKKRAFDGLSKEFVLREFGWRLDRLACGLYSLPIKVIDEDPRSRHEVQGDS
jgi:hypothetical protein